MSSKLQFDCNACGASGTIKINGDDDHEISVCPVCGNSLDIDHDDEEEDD